MTAKETLKKHIIESGDKWHGVSGDPVASKRFSILKIRLFSESSITEDLAHRTLLEIGFTMIREPEYERV